MHHTAPFLLLKIYSSLYIVTIQYHWRIIYFLLENYIWGNSLYEFVSKWLPLLKIDKFWPGQSSLISSADGIGCTHYMSRLVASVFYISFSTLSRKTPVFFKTIRLRNHFFHFNFLLYMWKKWGFCFWVKHYCHFLQLNHHFHQFFNNFNRHSQLYLDFHTY